MNPLLAVSPMIFAVVDLWLDCMAQRGLATPRALPCPGSVGEQPAALTDAFKYLDGLAAADSPPESGDE